jgi:hypothetical protein
VLPSSHALPPVRTRPRIARAVGILAGALGLAWIGVRGAIAVLCPLERPEVEGGGWIVAVEGVQTGFIFANVTLAAMGDIDGDGIADLAVGIPEPNEGAGRVHALSGKDGRRLRTWETDRRVGVAIGSLLLGLGDIDRGGVPDLAVGSGGDVLVLSTETGKRVFEVPGVEGNVFELRDAGDVDGDGLEDLGLTFARPQPRAEVWSSTGAGRLLAVSVIAPERFPVVNELDRRWLVCALGDVDGDGAGDVAVGSAPDWYSDEPLSRFHIGLVAAISGRTGAELWVVPGGVELDRWPSDLAPVSDRDGDGTLDLAIGSRGLVELRSGRTGNLLAPIEGPPRTDWGETVRSAGDVDGDGTEDLLVVCENPDVHSGLPFPSGGYGEVLSGSDFATLVRVALPCDAGPDELAAPGDLDGDGRADLVLGFPVADHSFVDFPCCDNLRAPRSWVALWTGSAAR